MCSSFQLYGFCLCLLSWSWLLISPSPIDKSCHLYSLLALPGSQKPGCSFYVNITVFDPHFVLMQQQQFCFHDFQVFSCGCQVTNFVCHLYIPGHVLSPLGHIFSHLFPAMISFSDCISLESSHLFSLKCLKSILTSSDCIWVWRSGILLPRALLTTSSINWTNSSFFTISFTIWQAIATVCLVVGVVTLSPGPGIVEL